MTAFREDRTDLPAGRLPTSIEAGGRVVFATDGKRSVLCSTEMSLGPWIGELIGAAPGVLAVYFVPGAEGAGFRHAPRAGSGHLDLPRHPGRPGRRARDDHRLVLDVASEAHPAPGAHSSFDPAANVLKH